MARRRGSGEGSIWKEGSSWRAAMTIDGQRITKSFKTRGEGQAWLLEIKNQVNQGLTYTATQLTLEKYISEWLSVHKASLTPKTGERYTQISRDYILPFLGKCKLKDLRVEKVEGLYHKLLDQGLSPRNVRWVHSVLHRCLNDAVKRGIVGFNPAHGARLPNLQQREMEILSESEIFQFLIAAQNSRHEALFHLAIKTGMRQGELLGLKGSDLNWRTGTLLKFNDRFSV